jgi:hypothetical protein
LDPDNITRQQLLVGWQYLSRVDNLWHRTSSEKQLGLARTNVGPMFYACYRHGVHVLLSGVSSVSLRSDDKLKKLTITGG